MLHSLYIRNYALIDELTLELGTGLNVITGETGAGKSILIGALGLILGNRVEGNVVNQGAGKCIVEGVFKQKSTELEAFFQSHELDQDTEIRMRRELTEQGKSRAFINDNLVNLSQMRELSSLLIDLNTQNHTYLFRQANYQLQLVDLLADNAVYLEQFSTQLKLFRKNQVQLDALKLQQLESQKLHDYLQFQFDELEESKLKVGEDVDIATELNRLEHIESIKQNLFASQQLLVDSDQNVLQNLEVIQNRLRTLSSIAPVYEALYQRIQSSLIELKDVSSELADEFENAEFDPDRLINLKERFDVIQRLLQKHQQKDLEALFVFKGQIANQLNDIGSLSDQISALQSMLSKTQLQLLEQSKILHQRRQAVLSKIEAFVASSLGNLGMKDAQFQVVLTAIDDFNSAGSSSVEFLFSSNKGHQPDSVARIASGGELSRLVLVLKSLFAEHQSVGSIVFDEIDTGVSGDIAGKVGESLRKMAAQMQVIAITHLPQIAALGSSHYKVSKYESQEKVFSKIEPLVASQRRHEVALMLSGNANSESALLMADELLQSTQ